MNNIYFKEIGRVSLNFYMSSYNKSMIFILLLIFLFSIGTIDMKKKWFQTYHDVLSWTIEPYRVIWRIPNVNSRTSPPPPFAHSTLIPFPDVSEQSNPFDLARAHPSGGARDPTKTTMQYNIRASHPITRTAGDSPMNSTVIIILHSSYFTRHWLLVLAEDHRQYSAFGNNFSN